MPYISLINSLKFLCSLDSCNQLGVRISVLHSIWGHTFNSFWFSQETLSSLSRVDRKSNSSVLFTHNTSVVKSGCASSTSVSSVHSSVLEISLPLPSSTYSLLVFSISQLSSSTSLYIFNQNSCCAVYWTSNIFFFLMTSLAEGFYWFLTQTRYPNQGSILSEASDYYLHVSITLPGTNGRFWDLEM